jgi:hypothetical protein
VYIQRQLAFVLAEFMGGAQCLQSP